MGQAIRFKFQTTVACMLVHKLQYSNIRLSYGADAELVPRELN